MTAANPYGVVAVYDGEVPRSFTAIASGTVSAGEFVVVSGVNNVVGSHISTYTDGDITVVPVYTVGQCNGIALNTATNGNLVTVGRRIDVIVAAGGSVIAGTPVQPLTAGLVASIVSGTNAHTLGAFGRAITPATSGTSTQYALVGLNL